MNLHNDSTLFDGDIDTGTRGKEQGNKDIIIYINLFPISDYLLFI